MRSSVPCITINMFNERLSYATLIRTMPGPGESNRNNWHVSEEIRVMSYTNLEKINMDRRSVLSECE